MQVHLQNSFIAFLSPYIVHKHVTLEKIDALFFIKLCKKLILCHVGMLHKDYVQLHLQF